MLQLAHAHRGLGEDALDDLLIVMSRHQLTGPQLQRLSVDDIRRLASTARMSTPA